MQRRLCIYNLLFLNLKYKTSLTRKTRASSSNLVVTIPSQLVEAYDISCGDIVEITPLKNGEIRIKKIDMSHASTGSVKTAPTTNPQIQQNHSPTQSLLKSVT